MVIQNNPNNVVLMCESRFKILVISEKEFIF
jgi:hypothetical protein